MIRQRTAFIFVQAALLATAWTVPVGAKQSGQQHQLDPVLQAIDPTQAHMAPVEPDQPPAQSGQMQPAAGWTAGYYPAQNPQQSAPPVAPLQASGGPDDPRLAKLEQLAFGSTYPEHDADDRIEHLEREEFGKTFTGDPESRIQRLAGKLNPQGAFSAPVASSAPPGVPQQPYSAPNNAQSRYQPPQQSPWQTGAPPSIPQQQYRPPQQQYQPPQQQYQPPLQTAMNQPPQAPWQTGAPPSIPQQQYRPPQQQYQPPQQQYQPPQQMPPAMVPPGAPPSIPAGPVTMSSFNRPQNDQPPQSSQQPPYPPIEPQQAQQQRYQSQQQYQSPSNQMQRQGSPSNNPINSESPTDMQSTGAPGLLDSIPYDKKAGDYLGSISRMGGSFARWTSLPVRVHIPMNTPDNARASIEGAVKRWSQFIPVVVAPPTDPADVEIGWINHLMPRQLGITNLEIFNGRPRVTVYLLRPNYYPPDVPEATLNRVCLHELGHALGLYGHSPTPSDAMYALDAPKANVPKSPNVTQRDTNTLRRVYEAAPLPEGFQSGQPISWP